MGVHNQWDTEALERAVNSVLAQTCGDFEFIIWNDGSDAGALELLNKLPSMDPRIRLAGCDENRGLAFSLNECIKMARGRYIARMDADDESLPDRFEKQVGFLESNKEYSWCGSAAELFDEDGTWGYRQMPEIPEKRDYYKYSPFIHPSVMFRGEIFNEENGYLESEETLRCEDYEMFMNLSDKGLKGYNLQDALFRYRETKKSYHKRTIRYRVCEARIRYQGFKKMGMLFPLGWLYVIRPIAACAVPPSLIGLVKRTEGRMAKEIRENAYTPDHELRRTFEQIPEYCEQGSVIQGKLKSIS
ncbi:MAG: glycosyltransferase [Lachnospiraceae bacterium]|nr:glycosyltransferase [Lachnospiraceae bacterium]